MDKIITVFGVFIILTLYFILIIGPGIIARLIFRKTDEIKLANRTAIIPTIIWFAKDDITGMVESFTAGLGYEDLNITKWLILFQLLFTFIICRFLADMGIGVADLLIKKRNPNQNIEPIVTTPVDKVEAQSTQAHV